MSPTFVRLGVALAAAAPLIAAGPSAAAAVSAPRADAGVVLAGAGVSAGEDHPPHLHGDPVPTPSYAPSTPPAPVATEHDAHAEMAGTDHGDADGTDAHDDHGVSGPAPERPRALVLGAFALVNGAVLIVAAVLRRRGKARPRHRPHASAAPTTA